MSQLNNDWIIGMDLGDKTSVIFGIERKTGEILESDLEMTEQSVIRFFSERPRCRVAFEVGGHSRWMKRILESLGFDVVVVDPRKLELISKSSRKNDRNDAMRLAELAASDFDSRHLRLLNYVEHRDDQKQADLTILKARDSLVHVRTMHVNHVRGAVKSMGARLPSCSTRSFHKLKCELPSLLEPALSPIMDLIEDLNTRITKYDRLIEKIQKERYQEANVLLRIRGVGTLSAMAYCLTLSSAERFKRSRDAAAYLGLCPRQHESGNIKKHLGISKTGDRFVRRLLVQCAQYILGAFGEDCDLRRWGEHLAKRGGSAAKKRAAVAVARKLATVMHRIWSDQSEYEPLRHAKTTAA